MVGGGELVLVVVGGGGGLAVLEVVGGGAGRVVVELVEVDEVVGGLTVVLVEVVAAGGRLVVVGGRVVVVVGRVVLVLEPTGSVAVEGVVLLVEVVLPAPTLVLVVGPVPGGRLVVVVLDTTTGAGHASGAGAFRAAKRPGLSFPTLPPKSRQ